MTEVDADVAIIGGGPSGLAAAIALREAGVERVLLLERETESGGALRHCGHPLFGLREFGRLISGPVYARRLSAKAMEDGVDTRTRHSVYGLHPGGVLDVATPDGALRVKARRVIIATGVRETPRSARLVSGDRPIGVMNTGALQASIYIEKLKPFSRPLLVGTELVGISAVWTCLSHGIRPSAILESAAEPIARWPLGLAPHVAGIPMLFGAEITDIRGRPRVEEIEVQDRNGVRRSVTADGIVFSGGFRPESALLSGTLDIDQGASGPAIDQYGRCSDTAYFATGNVLRAVETAGWCYREGWRTGRIVARDLAGRLPSAERLVDIKRGPSLKLTSPQKLAFPCLADVPFTIQLRAERAFDGTLKVIADDRVVWSRAIKSRPERRILIPTPWAPSVSKCETLTLEVH